MSAARTALIVVVVVGAAPLVGWLLHLLNVRLNRRLDRAATDEALDLPKSHVSLRWEDRP